MGQTWYWILGLIGSLAIAIVAPLLAPIPLVWRYLTAAILVVIAVTLMSVGAWKSYRRRNATRSSSSRQGKGAGGHDDPSVSRASRYPTAPELPELELTILAGMVDAAPQGLSVGAIQYLIAQPYPVLERAVGRVHRLKLVGKDPLTGEYKPTSAGRDIILDKHRK